MFKNLLMALSCVLFMSTTSLLEAGGGGSKGESHQEDKDGKKDKKSTQKKKKEKKEKKQKKEKREKTAERSSSEQSLESQDSQEGAKHPHHETIAALFDPHYYRGLFAQEIESSGLDPLAYFLHHGWGKGHSPAEWFDRELFKTFFGDSFEMLEKVFGLAQSHKKSKHKTGEEIVLSMTSHPPRIKSTWLSLFSILRQDVRPDHVILYLAEEDFPERQLPVSIEFLKRFGLEVRFSQKNYKVATKILPALQDFPKAVIITADDDRIYKQGWLRALLEAHQKYPQDIISPSSRRMVFTDGHAYGKPDQNGFPRIDYLCQSPFYDTAGFGIFEGFSGVLYPPHAFSPEVFDFEKFRALTPYADDVWLQTMAILKGTQTRGLNQDLTVQFRWPEEVPGTQESGLFHKHLRANDWMLYRALYYYGLLENVGVPTLKDPICPACQREIKIYEPKSELQPHKFKSGGLECSTCLNTHRRKVLVVGASGYGNIGDDIYPLVIRQVLGDRFRLAFAPDTTRMGKKGQLIEMDSDQQDYPFDALIIGGGGILEDFYQNSAIRYYIKRAIDQNKPYFFVSTGLQTHLQDPSVENVRKLLGDSAKLIGSANLIFVRSLQDSQLLSSVLGSSVSHKLKVAPDLGYSYPALIPAQPTSAKNYVTLIQTGSASVKSEYVRGLIDAALKKNPSLSLVVMNWGGSEDPGKSEDFQEFGLFERDVKHYYPEAKVYMGNSISPELKKLRYSNVGTRQSDLTPEAAINIVAQSQLLITGRYHGLILAKALGIPYKTPISTYKILSENESCLDISKANTQLEKVESYILRNGGAVNSPQSWSEDDRNSAIVKYAQEFGLPVPHVQSMSNKQLWEGLVFGREQ